MSKQLQSHRQRKLKKLNFFSCHHPHESTITITVFSGGVQPTIPPKKKRQKIMELPTIPNNEPGTTTKIIPPAKPRLVDAPAPGPPWQTRRFRFRQRRWWPRGPRGTGCPSSVGLKAFRSSYSPPKKGAFGHLQNQVIYRWIYLLRNLFLRYIIY